jgi:hypothetical protein
MIRLSTVEPEFASSVATTRAYAESEKAQAAGRAFSKESVAMASVSSC